MKIKKIITIILFCILIYSCRQDKTVHLTFRDFPETFELKGTKVESEIYFKIGMVYIYDSLIIIASSPQAKCVHIYNKNTYKYILSTGRVGHGPNEISNPGLSCLDKTNGILWCNDFGKKKIWQLNISEILADPDYLPDSAVALPHNKFFIRFLPRGKNLFSFSNTDQNIFISYFNRKGELVDSMNVPNRLNVYGKMDDNTRMYTSTYIYQTHPVKDLHVIAYRMADVVAIIDANGNLVSMAKGPGKVMQTPNYSDNFYIETNEGVIVSDKLIYCLYSGEKKYEIKDGEMAHNYAKKLLVYSWAGRPVAAFGFEYSVVSFDIDFENNRMFTFSPETGGIVYYDLPKL